MSISGEAQIKHDVCHLEVLITTLLWLSAQFPLCKYFLKPTLKFLSEIWTYCNLLTYTTKEKKQTILCPNSNMEGKWKQNNS